MITKLCCTVKLQYSALKISQQRQSRTFIEKHFSLKKVVAEYVISNFGELRYKQFLSKSSSAQLTICREFDEKSRVHARGANEASLIFDAQHISLAKFQFQEIRIELGRVT